MLQPGRTLSGPVLLKRPHPLCRGGCGGPMSFWLPPSAPRSLDPGLRREDDEINQRQLRALSRFSDSFVLLRLPRESGGLGAAVAPLPRGGPDLSAVNLSPARCIGSLEKMAPSVPRRSRW